MSQDLIRRIGVRQAINPIYATTNHATTATAVDARGYSRALWAISVGAMAATAVIDMEVQNSATLAGTYADVTSAALTDITSAGANKAFFIDHAVSGSYPFLKLAGTCRTARATVSAICILYGKNGIVRDPYTTAGQVVDL